MNHCRTPLKAAAMALAVLAGTTSLAWADGTAPATQPDVSSEIQALRARIDQLEAQQKQQQADHEKEQQQAALAQTERDAQQHSQMLDVHGLSAGYDSTSRRFFIGTDDGSFMLRPWYHLQFRAVANNRQDFNFNGKGKDETDTGFEVRRMKIGLDGNMFGPDFTYFFNWATSRANGSATVTSSTGATVGTVSNSLGGVPILEEAWVKYRFHDTPFYIKAGQIKDPVLHDQIVSSRYQDSTERSLIADVFVNGDAFTQGVTFIVDPQKWFRTEAGVNQGMRSANTNFFDTPTNAQDWGVAGRVELKAFGRWQDYGQVGSVDTKEPLLVFGLGADYSQRGHSGQTVTAVDAMYADQHGLLLYGAFVSRYTTHNFGIWAQTATGGSIAATNPAVTGKSTYEYAPMIEAGYTFNSFVEPFGRFEYMHLQGTKPGSNNWVQAITGGVNFFFHGHRLKLTPEVIYLPKGFPIDDGASDVYTSAPGRSEIVGEIQLQLLI
ncbi:MAG TPA: hypothetical protein VGI81_17150 [Tepidisphaeraceae bacterium]